MEILDRSGGICVLNEEDAMVTKRRHFSGYQKTAILKRYLVEKTAL
jgi:hypothetical protein